MKRIKQLLDDVYNGQETWRDRILLGSLLFLVLYFMGPITFTIAINLVMAGIIAFFMGIPAIIFLAFILHILKILKIYKPDGE